MLIAVVLVEQQVLFRRVEVAMRVPARPGEWRMYLWLLIFGVVFIWSAIEPKDTFTWILEVAPAVIGLLVLAVTYNNFRLTPLLYIMILIHCIILMVGGHYTYAEVPLFEEFKTIFGFE